MKRFVPVLARPLVSPAARARRRRWVAAVAAVLLVGFAYVFIAGDSGWLHLRRQRAELATLAAEVGRLQAENDSLRQVLWRLENDPAYVEKVAREEYFMVLPGERLYRTTPPADGD